MFDNSDIKELLEEAWNKQDISRIYKAHLVMMLIQKVTTES